MYWHNQVKFHEKIRYITIVPFWPRWGRKSSSRWIWPAAFRFSFSQVIIVAHRMQFARKNVSIFSVPISGSTFRMVPNFIRRTVLMILLSGQKTLDLTTDTIHWRTEAWLQKVGKCCRYMNIIEDVFWQLLIRRKKKSFLDFMPHVNIMPCSIFDFDMVTRSMCTGYFEILWQATGFPLLQFADTAMEFLFPPLGCPWWC